MKETPRLSETLLLGAACRYRLIRRIGSGGFGEVWLVEEPERGERYAAKLLLPEVSDHDAVQERFLREIRTGVRLDHPHIIKVVDAGWLGQTRQAFFVMDFVDGAPLDQLRYNFVALLEMMRQLLQALAYAHARGVVHRDIKPENVLVARAPGGFQVKLLDFGIAMIGDGIAARSRRNLTQPGAPMGTLAYMSPEQASGEPSSVGSASDLYSLGIALYECLAGRPPFSGKGLALLVKHCAHLPPELSPREGMPAPLPPAMSELVSSLLQKRYNDRPHFAAEVSARLGVMLDELRRVGGPGSVPWVEWPAVEAASAATEHEPAEGDRHAELATSDTVMSGAELPARSVELSRAEVEGATMASFEAGAPPSLFEAIHGAASPVVRVRAALSPGESIAGERKLIHRLRVPPLVGRAAEREALTRAVQHVLRTRGSRCVLMQGTVGVGKSRLGRWLTEEVHQAGSMRVLRVNLADHDGLPGAIHNTFYRYLRMPRLERRPLMERIEDVLEMTGEYATQLANFLLWEVSAHTTGQAEGGTGRQIEAWPRLWHHVLSRIQRVPDERPLLIWLDGPDEAEHLPTVRAWAGFMARTAERQSASMLFVWTVRREVAGAAEPGWGGEHFEVVELAPLAAREEARLLTSLAPTLAPRVVAELGLRTQGNPLFATELVWGLVDSGDLVAGEEGLELSARARAEQSVSLEDVLRRQVTLFLEQFSDREGVSLGLAALAFMGATFPPAQLDGLFEGTGVTTEDLISYGIVSARLMSRDARVALSSASLRDLLLEQARSQGIAARATSLAVEVRIRGAISALIHADWDAAEQSLRYVWGLLGQVEVDGAVLHRLEVLDLMAATSFRRREPMLVRGCANTIDQLRGAAGGEHAQRLLAAAHFWKGRALYIEQAFDEAMVEFAVASDEAAGCGDLARMADVLHAKAVIRTEQGDVEEGSRLAKEGYDVVRGVLKHHPDDAIRPMLQLLEADLVSLMAHQRRSQGELTAAAALQRRVLRVFADLGDRQGEAHTQLALSRNLGSLGDDEGAHRHRERARLLLEVVDDRRGRALLAWEDAAAALKDGRYEDADQLFLEAYQLFTTIHDKASAAMAVNGRGEAARKAKRYNDAVTRYLEFRDAMREFGITYAEGMAYINLGWTLLEAGEPSRAIGQFDAARKVLTEETPRMVRVDACVGQALARLRLHDDVGSYSALDDAVAVADGNAVADEDSRHALEVLRDAEIEHVDLGPLARRLLGAAS